MTKYIASTIFAALFGIFTLNAQTATVVTPAGLDTLITNWGETPDDVTNKAGTALGQSVEFECGGSDSTDTYKAVMAWVKKAKVKSGYGATTTTDLGKVVKMLVLRDFKSPTKGTVGTQTIVVFADGSCKFVLEDDIVDSWETYASCDQPAQCTVVCTGKLGDDKPGTTSAPLATATNAAKMPWQKK